MGKSKLLARTAVVCTCAAAAVGTMVLVTAGGSANTLPGVSPDLTAHFALFARGLHAHRTSQSTVTNASSSPRIPPPVINYLGLSSSDTQFVQSGSVGAWAVPGTSGACLISTVSISTGSLAGTSPNVAHCETTSEIQKDGLVDSVSIDEPLTNSRSALLVSLIPNGNASVGVSGAGSEGLTVPVVDNIAVVKTAVLKHPLGWVTLTYKNVDGVPTSIRVAFRVAKRRSRVSVSRETYSGRAS